SHRRAATRRGRRRVLGLAMREECLQSESHAPIIAGAALFSLIALDSPAFVVLLGRLLSLAFLMGSRSPVGPSWMIRVSSPWASTTPPPEVYRVRSALALTKDTRSDLRWFMCPLLALGFHSIVPN